MTQLPFTLPLSEELRNVIAYLSITLANALLGLSGIYDLWTYWNTAQTPQNYAGQVNPIFMRLLAQSATTVLCLIIDDPLGMTANLLKSSALALQFAAALKVNRPKQDRRGVLIATAALILAIFWYFKSTQDVHGIFFVSGALLFFCCGSHFLFLLSFIPYYVVQWCCEYVP